MTSRLLPVDGVRVSACSASLYATDRKDLALISFPPKANCAAVFTGNSFRAAPVTVSQRHLDQGAPSFCLINAGNANAGLGEAGIADALAVCQELADQANVAVECILPFSTGVIGEPLPVSKIKRAIPTLLGNLSDDAWRDVADAILTTDTRSKGISRKLMLADGEITVTGIAKGSGMLRPDMATMLAFIATDANIEKSQLRHFLGAAVTRSFNCIHVDGATSTNDACFIAATGGAGIDVADEASKHLFLETLTDVCVYLAQSIVRDGEGATKFISIHVSGGASEQECKKVALAVADSPLVKTAFFASDPNWGRILVAVGQAPLADLDISKISIALGDVQIVEAGRRADTYTEAEGQRVMRQEEITVNIKLNRGNAATVVWTCDLSHEYIRINSEYRS